VTFVTKDRQRAPFDFAEESFRSEIEPGRLKPPSIAGLLRHD